MMLIYDITEVTFCMSLSKYHDEPLVAKDVFAYKPCSRAHKKFILTANLLKILQINLKIMNIDKIEKLTF